MRKIFTHKTVTLPELTAVHVDGKRYYITPSGARYMSVSTVVGSLNKQAVAEWRARVGEEEARKISGAATTFGTSIHKIIEDYIDNKEGWLDFAKPKEKIIFNAAKETLDRIDNVYCQEGTLYSDVLRLAGRVDCIAEFDGIPSIIDFKTSSKEKREEWITSYFLQTTAYSLAFQELTGISIPRIVILVMTSDGIIQTFIKNRKDYYKQLKEVILETRRN